MARSGIRAASTSFDMTAATARCKCSRSCALHLIDQSGPSGDGLCFSPGAFFARYGQRRLADKGGARSHLELRVAV